MTKQFGKKQLLLILLFSTLLGSVLGSSLFSSEEHQDDHHNHNNNAKSGHQNHKKSGGTRPTVTNKDIKHFGYCPRGSGWREAPFMCWRESSKSKSFQDALQYSYDDDLEIGPFVNLIPVGKLRRFNWLIDSSSGSFSDSEEHHVFHHEGPFRVNAIKNHYGEWVEYPSGKKVSFHHFPHFNKFSGDEGDTLIWHPEGNRLSVAEADALYPAIAYRPKLGLCSRCPDFDLLDNECNDAGDCWRGKCICDNGFMGFKCQIETNPHLDVLVVGGSDNSQTLHTVEIYDVENGGSIDALHPFPEAIIGGVGTWVNKKHWENFRSKETDIDHHGNRALVCGGMTIHNETLNNCYSFDYHRQKWVVEPFMHTDRSYSAASTLLPSRNWWVLGGGSSDSIQLSTTEILDVSDSEERSSSREENIVGHWKGGPKLPQPVWGPCAVQISNCETAVIGGFSGLSSSSQIFIYNWHHETWHAGPSLLVSRENPSCALLRYPYNNNKIVLIAGGYNSSNGYLRSVEAWNLNTNGISYVQSMPVQLDDHQIVQWNENQLLLIGGDFNGESRSPVYSFDFERGWELNGQLATPRQGHVAVLVPKHYAYGKTGWHERIWQSHEKLF